VSAIISTSVLARELREDVSIGLRHPDKEMRNTKKEVIRKSLNIGKHI
jgi:hypothetical protein